MAKVHEDVIRDVLKTIDMLNAHGVELAADETAVFYSECGRKEQFRLTYRSDEYCERGFYYEVMV